MRIERSRKDDRLFNFMCGVVIFLFLWCERVLRSRVTLRKEGQVELSGERPKQLSAARCWRASMDGVNPNLWDATLHRTFLPSESRRKRSPSLNAPSRDCEP